MCATLAGCFASPPQIIDLSPNRGTIAVPADAPIAVEFDRPVVRSTVVGRFAVEPALSGCDLTRAFSAPQQAPCRITWQAGDTLFTLLHPGAVLAPATRYTFTLRGGFSDTLGVVNSIDHQWDLTSAVAPEVRVMEPADGATGVPVDTPMSVGFSTPMASTETAAAIHLDPPVTGTRVLRNSGDASRFVVVPGRLLESGVTYRLSIASTATDEHHQRLLGGVVARFTTAGISAVPHVLVLAGAPGEGATALYLSSLKPAQPGDPPSAEGLLVAPRCSNVAGCGTAADGGPLYTFRAATLSPDGRWLAVEETDATVAGARPVLLVLDAARVSVVTSFAAASLASWSPDSSTLAFSRAGEVALYKPGSGEVSALPAGDPLLEAPAWSPLGEQLVLDVGGTPDLSHVELADAEVLARYPVPGLVGLSSAPVISPDGLQLALLRSSPEQAGTWICGIGAAPAALRQVDAHLAPVGFTGTGTLLAIAGQAAVGTPGLVLVSVADDTQIPLAGGPAPAFLGSVVVAAPGRQLAYLSPDAGGNVQAFVENADGSNPRAVTAFPLGELAATSIAVSG